MDRINELIDTFNLKTSEYNASVETKSLISAFWVYLAKEHPNRLTTLEENPLSIIRDTYKDESNTYQSFYSLSVPDYWKEAIKNIANSTTGLNWNVQEVTETVNGKLYLTIFQVKGSVASYEYETEDGTTSVIKKSTSMAVGLYSSDTGHMALNNEDVASFSDEDTDFLVIFELVEVV